MIIPFYCEDYPEDFVPEAEEDVFVNSQSERLQYFPEPSKTTPDASRLAPPSVLSPNDSSNEKSSY